MQFDQVADDREPEAEPAMRPRRAAVGLPEPLEHVWQELRRDAAAGVGDAQFDLITGLARR